VQRRHQHWVHAILSIDHGDDRHPGHSRGHLHREERVDGCFGRRLRPRIVISEHSFKHEHKADTRTICNELKDTVTKQDVHQMAATREVYGTVCQRQQRTTAFHESEFVVDHAEFAMQRWEITEATLVRYAHRLPNDRLFRVVSWLASGHYYQTRSIGVHSHPL